MTLHCQMPACISGVHPQLLNIISLGAGSLKTTCQAQSALCSTRSSGCRGAMRGACCGTLPTMPSWHLCTHSRSMTRWACVQPPAVFQATALQRVSSGSLHCGKSCAHSPWNVCTCAAASLHLRAHSSSGPAQAAVSQPCGLQRLNVESTASQASFTSNDCSVADADLRILAERIGMCGVYRATRRMRPSCSPMACSR